MKRPLLCLFFPDAQGGKEGADTDTRRTLVVYFVNF